MGGPRVAHWRPLSGAVWRGGALSSSPPHGGPMNTLAEVRRGNGTTSAWTAAWLLALAGVGWASDARADLGDEVAACEVADFQRCAALQTAAASRKAEIPAIAAKLTADATPAVAKARLALGLAMLDAREHKDALDTAAKQLTGAPELADVRAAQARLGDPRATADLLALVAAGQPLRSRLLAAGALGVLHAKEGADPLILALTDPKVPRMQAEAAKALAAIGDPRAELPLANLAGAPAAFVPARTEALRALLRLSPARARTLALLLVSHPSAEMGRAAIEVLRAHWQSWAEPAVLAALDLPGRRGEAARVAADRQLAGMGPKLLTLLPNGDLAPDELVFVLDAIGKLKTAGASQVLLKRLKSDAAVDEKIELLKTFPKLGDLTILAELVPYLGDAENRIVANTVYALENLTGQHLGPDIKAWRRYSGLDPALKVGKEPKHPAVAPAPAAP